MFVQHTPGPKAALVTSYKQTSVQIATANQRTRKRPQRMELLDGHTQTSNDRPAHITRGRDRASAPEERSHKTKSSDRGAPAQYRDLLRRGRAR